MSTQKTTLLSIDLGTKNLAYCVLTVNTDKTLISVKRWGIINIHTHLPTTASKKPTISDLNIALQRSLLKEELEKDVDLVAIENQPAGFHRNANTKMKTLSHCIEAYMFHKCPGRQVVFVSPKGKFCFSPADEVDRVKRLKTAAARYRNHKRMAIEAVQNRINSGALTLEDKTLSTMWSNSKKKDDLADCLLQGMYCIGLRS